MAKGCWGNRSLQLAVFGMLLGLSLPIHAAELSTDVTVTIAGVIASDAEVINRGNSPFSFPGIPAGADLTGYHRFADDDVLVTFDSAVLLPGNIFARAGDVIRFNGVGYSIEWDASAAGLPRGVISDAVTYYQGDLALSFDTSVMLPGDVFLDDEDLVRINGNGFEVLLDGSALGIDAATNMDAASYFQADNGDLFFLSFSESGQIGGIAYDDEDVLSYNASMDQWSLFYDGSTRFAAQGIDIDAVFVSIILFSDGFENP